MTNTSVKIRALFISLVLLLVAFGLFHEMTRRLQERYLALGYKNDSAVDKLVKQVVEQIAPPKPKESDLPVASPVVTPTPQTPGQDQISFSKVYSAPDDSLYFYFYKNQASDTPFAGCDYVIMDKVGARYWLPESLGLMSIPCNDGMADFLYTDVFKSMGENGTMLFEIKSGELALVDVLNQTTKTLAYGGSGKTSFVLADNTLSYFLMMNTMIIGTDKNNAVNSYMLYDKTMNLVAGPWKTPLEGSMAFYDEVNDGFLIIHRFFEGEMVETTLAYVSLKDFVMRELLHNQPVIAPGRGCGPLYLDSKSGLLRLQTGGCPMLDAGVIDDEGWVTLPLEP